MEEIYSHCSRYAVYGTLSRHPEQTNVALPPIHNAKDTASDKRTWVLTISWASPPCLPPGPSICPHLCSPLGAIGQASPWLCPFFLPCKTAGGGGDSQIVKPWLPPGLMRVRSTGSAFTGNISFKNSNDSAELQNISDLGIGGRKRHFLKI
jgi:hypothetical protein